MILCVDPDPSHRDTTRDALSNAGFTSTGGESLQEGKRILAERTDVECVVTEYDLPDGTGLELIQHAREETPDATCILFTDVPLDDVETADFGETVAEYLNKDAADAHEELVTLVEHSFSFLSQTAYPLPEDEQARRAVLDSYAVESDALGEALDRLTELATALFDVDSAAVGLIEAHHERFLSCHGADFESMNREDAICTYTILDEGITVVENVPEDPRFSENEGLAAADITFYAGAPLVTSDGAAIGTLCLQDSEPRTFPERDRKLLSLLAEEVMEQLELRRRLQSNTEGDEDG